VLIVLLGATATGKSRLALDLAAGLPWEIVNADALQVYRGLDIGTAKPSVAERARIPHHLLDVVDPWQRFSAGDFARAARESITQIERRGRQALVVGGSGFYLRALLEGISPLPRADPTVREGLARRARLEGVESLHRELGARDAASARRIAPRDAQRVLRALEVVQQTGVPLSQWQARQPFGRQRVPAIKFGLTLPRGVLYSRIFDRVVGMVGAGWLDEIDGMLAAGVSPEAAGFQAIGYRQMVRVLTRQSSQEEAILDTVRCTRRFVKRQETWFRKEKDVIWLDATNLDHARSDLLRGLEAAALAGAT
jgi:tRNA dimethylallyltransferase